MLYKKSQVKATSPRKKTRQGKAQIQNQITDGSNLAAKVVNSS